MEESIRLNLGSGINPVDGWINVDLDPQADVQADLRKLPFEDAYADEVQAIHVIEHILFWEVQDILREWKRVLKPGGKIALECPDLIKCARHIVSAANRGELPHPRVSIWGIFGDPHYRNELMLHKWAYTPETLKGELFNAGFVDIEEEAPTKHLKELRDLRVVARKP